ncbi:infection structure specific [Fusarium acutatum]|uniref:Infection structure specific n=1 Tax=Fusarium acutatum TaxID=78861 RepID=A0A8H4JDC7_9HYPO|nr:infection structure specific [Fusarium acutatum]
MQSIILTSLLATAVSANFMAHPLMKRDLLAPRATAPAVGGITEECQTAILDVYKTLPTPPPAIVSDLTENPQTDPCSFSTPASLSKDYSSYSSQILSWYSKNEDEIKSALSECPELSQYATAVPVCATAALGGKGGAESATTTAEKPEKTGDKTAAAGEETAAEGEASTPTSSAAAVETNGAAREGGFIYAAAAVAGVVVAAL